jgi:hypothetical protein
MEAYNHTTSCGELVKDCGEGGKGILTPQDRFLIDGKFVSYQIHIVIYQ